MSKAALKQCYGKLNVIGLKIPLKNIPGKSQQLDPTNIANL